MIRTRVLIPALLATALALSYLAYYFGIAFAFLILFLMVASIFTLKPPVWKQQLLSAFGSGAVWQPATSETYGVVSDTALDKLTHELIGLGFEMEGDYSSGFNSQREHAFTRVFFHPGHRCGAQLMRLYCPVYPARSAARRRKPRTLPLTCSITSRMAAHSRRQAILAEFDAEARQVSIPTRLPPLPEPESPPDAGGCPGIPDGLWNLTTQNQRINGVQYMLRHPRLLGRYMPGATVAELLSTNLSERERIVTELRLELLPALPAAERRVLAQRHINDMHARLRYINPWRGFIEASLIAPRVREWRGDRDRSRPPGGLQ